MPIFCKKEFLPMKLASSSQQTFVHKHKLPPKLVELVKSSDSSSVVGFGTTPEQQDFMLLSAILNSKNIAFVEELKHELDEYFLTLSNSLLVHSNN